VYGKRIGAEKESRKSSNKKDETLLDGIKNTVNQLTKMGSVVSIPDEAKLLKANTLLLELFVSI
jgi:hypothetical protein